jgi:DnaK suppressor protein
LIVRPVGQCPTLTCPRTKIRSPSTPCAESSRSTAAPRASPERGTAQGFGKRIGDGTTEAVGRLTEIGVGRSLESTLARIERALAKLDDGTYGTCDACGGPIEPDRLRARRDSVLCLACAAAERRAAPPRRR